MPRDGLTLRVRRDVQVAMDGKVREVVRCPIEVLRLVSKNGKPMPNEAAAMQLPVKRKPGRPPKVVVVSETGVFGVSL